MRHALFHGKYLKQIKESMQSNKVEEITDKLEGHLSIDTEKMDKYDRYRQEGKEAVKRGDLPRALELFELAYQLQPSDKLKKRIQAIQDLIQRDEEEEEFVDVNNSGLMLYKGLYDKLYDHQKDGVAFLYSLYRDERKGGILADDMGLGKTIQVISFLSGMYDAELANHTLLVMPTSLINNWVREFTKWTPGLKVKEFHGTSKAQRNRNLEWIQCKGGVIITTYQMLINNCKQLGSYDQREFKWDYVILDEAHKIKTSSTKTAKSAYAIPAKNRVLLTGTPVQNNLQEMWALFDFACHGSLLGTSKTFKTEYENPITRAREKDATPGEKALGLRISQNLMDIIKPYFLRRTKADVQHKKQKREEGYEDEEDQENKCPNAGEGVEMPSLTRKNDLIVWTYLSSVQEDIYNQFISLDHIKQLLTTTRSPLAELTVLKKLCDHPRLLSNRAVTQLGLEQGSASHYIHPDNETESAVSQIDNLSDDTLVAESGKLQFLVSLMECLREEGHRTLIFSQSRKMLDIMERVLRNRNFRLLRLDGTVTQLAEREKRIKSFQTDKRYTIFLLTTQVGGVGITLTAANRVVIFDPSWNPATDAQAVDRAYRIGQTENVIIYRLITCGTVEERIYRRQVFKDSLIRQTTGDKKNPFRYFSKQDLHELFKLEDTRSSTTQQQLQAMHAQNRRSDTSLNHHITRLHTMEMFGISDHDLMFTKEVAADEDNPEDAESHHYIQTRVQKAQELMQAESELHGQLMDSMVQNTELAWLRQMDQPKSAVRARPAPPRVKKELVTVDLTHNSYVESELEKDEQNFPPVEDAKVKVVSEDVQIADEEDQVGNESPWSAGERNVHVSPAADKLAHTVITLDDSSDEEDELHDNAASEKQNFPSPSRQFPKLEELFIASDALDNEEVQMDKPNLKMFSSPQSPNETTEGESFKAEVEMLQGNFNLQLEDSADMFSVEEEEACNVEESLAEESPGFQLQMDISEERLEESRQDGNQNNIEISNCNNSEVFNPNTGEVSKHESPLRIHSAPDTPANDSFVHLVQRKKRQVISDTDKEDKEEEESEKPCLTSSPLANGLSRLGSSTPKSTLIDSSQLRRSLNTSVASRRSFVLSMLENDSDEESAEPSEDKTKSYEISEANESHADESMVEEEELRGDQTKSYEISEASESHADESVVEEEELRGDQTKSYDISEASESHADESVVEEEELRGDQTKSYEISEASESHANESVVEEEELRGDQTKSYEISEASESHADESVVEEEELRGDQTKSYEISEASESHADESVVEEEELRGDQTKSYEISEASESHADESVVEEEELRGDQTKSYEISEASESHADESVVEEELCGDQTKSFETSEARESHANESAVEEEEPSEDKSESYQISEVSEAHGNESVVEEEEPSGETLNSEESARRSFVLSMLENDSDEGSAEPSEDKTKSYEISEANESHADESVVEEEELSGDQTKSYEISEASESHADESMVEEEELRGDQTKSYEISEASESHADESVVEEEELRGDQTKSYEVSEASESHADESVVEEEELRGDQTKSYEISEASESHADESVEEEEELRGDQTKFYEMSEASESHADESVVEEELCGDQTKSYEILEARESHENESAVEEEEPSEDKSESYQISEVSEAHGNESVVEEEEPSGETLNSEESARRSFVLSMLENDSDEESAEPSEDKTKSYEISEANESHADESVVEEEELSGDQTKSYEISEASESHADESVVEEEELRGDQTKSYEISEASESHADESVVEEEELRGDQTKSYEISEASESHADESVVEEEELRGDQTKSYEISEASESHADGSVVEEEELRGDQTKSYEISEASESHAHESVVEEEELSGDQTKSYEISEASESHADESVVEEEELRGDQTKSYEISEASESHADESVVEEEELRGDQTKSYEISEASESHADESVEEEEELRGDQTKFYEMSEASESHADESVVEEELCGDQTKSYEILEARESHENESAVEEEEPSEDKSESYQISEVSEAHGNESVVEEEEPSGETLNSEESARRSFVLSMLENDSDEESAEPSEDKTKSYEISEANESHADESVVEEEELSGDQTKSYEISEASESHADESVVEEEELSGDQTKSYEISEASESHADESVVEEEELRGDQTKSYEISEASESHADESVVEEEELRGDQTKSYEISEASESHADESVVEEEELRGDQTKSYEISEASESHADESVVEEEELRGDQTKSYEISEASESHADESVVEEEELCGDQTKSYETSEARESHANESAVEEEEPSEDKSESYQISEVSEAHGNESVVEEEEPSGETLNSEESASHEELEEMEESLDSRGDQEHEEWHSALLESTADVELDSNEMMDQCGPKTFPPETHILLARSTVSHVTAAEPSENTYEMLVLSGKQCLAEGRKQAALDFFLKAIDINTGDAEIQLLIIQLYRQLSQ